MNLRLALETEDLRLDPATVRTGVERLLQDVSKGLYFVAEADGRLAGQVMITYEWSDWRNANIWWFQSVYVFAEFRRHGVFRRLFEYVTERARTEGGVSSLRLYMHDGNERARSTYERLGMLATHYQVFEMPLNGAGG
jgi:GNAT superfamily N-acetyltransferase